MLDTQCTAGGKMKEYYRLRLLLRREMMMNQENFARDIHCITP